MNNYFGENIRTLRKERDMTQETLAEFLGVSFQAVSKWERGETYPDLAMLPAIASFFNVTTDYLLGIDKIKKENAVNEYIEFYQREWKSGDFDKLCRRLKEGIGEFPGEWSLIIRYFNSLVTGAIRTDKAVTVRNEAESIYSNIQKHCTTDSIRIWANKIMAIYYKSLCSIPESGITMENIMSIVENMPLMQNGRDYIATSVLPMGEEYLKVCQNALCELVYMTNETASKICDCDISTEAKINLLNGITEFTRALYGNGLGKNYAVTIWNYALLGKLYLEMGYYNTASAAFEESLCIAKQYDVIADGEEIIGTTDISNLISICKERIPKYRGCCETNQVSAFIKSLPNFEKLKLELQ